VLMRLTYLWRHSSKLMQTLYITILNPKATRLLEDLADLQLIAIEPANDEFRKLLDKLRSQNATLTEEEIAREVEIVRAERYASNG